MVKQIVRDIFFLGQPSKPAAKTTGLHKISKEILAKRGLVSCLDYYLN